MLKRYLLFTIGMFTLGSTQAFSSNSKIPETASAIRINIIKDAQAIQNIKGVVSDENGEPLPGATVKEKDKKNQTLTDMDGNFSINVADENAILEISFVGFVSQEVAVKDRVALKIVLTESKNSLNEIVVIGYGSVKKKDLTGSVVRANIDAFKEAPNVSIVESLQGTVAGLNVGINTSPGNNPSISIRGQNNLGGVSNTPLIVLDGAIYYGNVADINKNDVASVDILKDASATAIYGSSAANGVIIITTKRGKSDGVPVFSYSGNYSALSPLKKFTPMDREGYAQKVRDVRWKEAFLAPDYIQPNPDFKLENYLLTPNSQDGYLSGNDFNWVDQGLRTGLINDQNLSMAQSTDKTSYFISANYTQGNGVVKNDNYNKFTVRVNFENKFSDWLKIGLNSFITPSDYSGYAPNLGTLYGLTPFVTPYDSTGNLKNYPDDGLVLNPLLYKTRDNFDKRLNLFANANLQIDVPWVKGLSYKLQYTNSYITRRNYGYNPQDNAFKGSASKNNSLNSDWQIDNILDYKKTFNNKHDVNITLIAGRDSRSGEATNAESGIFPIDGLSYNRLEDGDITKQLVSSSAYSEENIHYMGRAAYIYKSKYFFTGTIRRDGFSSFGVNHKFALFPSAAVAWAFSEENFMKNIDWLTYGKLRASYGSNGANTIPRYSTLAGISSGFYYVFGGQSAFGIVPNRLANGDLKWETTTGLNLALDFEVLKSRIGGSIEYYNTNTTNILVQIPIPDITGFSTQSTNLGKVHNDGFNISLNTTNIKQTNFSWNSAIVFSINKNEIVSVLGRDDNNDGIEDDLIASNYFIGQPYGVVYDYTYQGIYQLGDTDIPSYAEAGQYRWKDISGPDGKPDGNITPAYDRTILGYTDPKYRWSLLNEFTYKNFGFSFFLNSIQGGKDGYYGRNEPFNNFSRDNAVRYNYVKEGSDLYWTPSNPNAPYRQLYLPDQRSNSRYFQRSFVRLQNIALSYNLPQPLLKKIGLSGLKVYVSGKNLKTWTNWIGLDPETGASLTPGSYPVLKSYNIGMDLSF